MIEAENAITELKRLRDDVQRRIRTEEYARQPDQLQLRRLWNENARLHAKQQRIAELHATIKELESALTMKMMNRYPENKPYRNEYKRELHRTRLLLLDVAAKYQPKPPTRRYGSALRTA